MTDNPKLSDEQLRDLADYSTSPHKKSMATELLAARATIEALTGERDRQYEANAILIAKEGAAIIKIDALRASLAATLPSLSGRDIALRDHIKAILAQPAESGGIR